MKLVLVRHGQSLWNKENRFTGWKDVDLTEQGRSEAFEAGRLIKEEGIDFDIVYTSVLKRAIRTMWIILDEMDRMWLPVIRSWRLNERFYGALQGLNKSETAKKYGEDQVHIWRRSYDTPPPEMTLEDKEHPIHDIRYKDLEKKDFPLSESLKTTAERFLPYWNEVITKSVQEEKNILIVAHGNSLRALVQHLDQLSPEEIMKVDIPTGVPLIYDISKTGEVSNKRYLGNQDKIKKAMEEVANQGKNK